MFFITVPLMVFAIAIATIPLVVATAVEHRRNRATVPAVTPPNERAIGVGGPTW